MDIEIVILSPSEHCKKCNRFIKLVEEAIQELDFELGFRIISDIEEMLEYNTWLLPSLFINKQLVSRSISSNKEQLTKLILKLHNE